MSAECEGGGGGGEALLRSYLSPRPPWPPSCCPLTITAPLAAPVPVLWPYPRARSRVSCLVPPRVFLHACSCSSGRPIPSCFFGGGGLACPPVRPSPACCTRAVPLTCAVPPSLPHSSFALLGVRACVRFSLWAGVGTAVRGPMGSLRIVRALAQRAPFCFYLSCLIEASCPAQWTCEVCGGAPFFVLPH